MARQAEIVDYLNQLIDEKKTKVIHKSPIDIFDSFMRTSEIKETSKFKSTTSKSTTKKTTTKYIFHGIFEIIIIVLHVSIIIFTCCLVNFKMLLSLFYISLYYFNCSIANLTFNFIANYFTF